MPKPSLVQFESIRPALAEIERAIVWAYQTFGGDYLDASKLTVVVQTRGRKAKCMGFFAVNRWSTREGDKVHEVSISSEFLDRDVLDIIAIAVHETVHLLNHNTGIKDVSKGGRHNKRFRETAEIFGLSCADPHDSYGFGYTSMTDDLRTAITTDFQPDYAAFTAFRLPVLKVPAEKKLQAWICECPVTVQVAIKTELVAECHACGIYFKRKEAAE